MHLPLRNLKYTFILAFIFCVLPCSAFAAIAIDASGPIRATSAQTCVLGTSNVTTASFNPPDNSVLLVMVNIDTCGTTPIPADTVTITNNSTALTWTRATKEEYTDSGNGGYAGIFYSSLTTGRTGMTITASHSFASTISIKVYVVTGANTNSPIGTTNKGSSNSNVSTGSYSSGTANSRGFAVGTDWNALGTPSSTDTADAFTSSGNISGESLNKSADTAVAGTTVNFNFDAAGTNAASWNWVAAEVKPAVAGPEAGNPRFKLINRRVNLMGSRMRI